MRDLFLELFKNRRKWIWLVVGAMVGLQLIWGVWNLSRMDETDLAQGWMYCLYQNPLLNSIIMPVLTAVIASRLCDMEHKGQTFRLIRTLQPAGKLFDMKFLSSTVYIFSAILLQLIGILLLGYIGRFTDSFPVSRFLDYFLSCTFVSLTILLLQQVLSLLWSNQLVSLTVGLLGSFAGLFSLFLPREFQYLLLWSYYGVLMPVGMDWDKTTNMATLYWQPVNWFGYGLLILLFFMIYFLGRYLFIRKEV